MEGQGYVYDVLIELTHRRNFWYYFGTYNTYKAAYNGAIRREREYLLDTPIIKLSRFQIIKKRHRNSRVYHTELHVRSASRDKENLYYHAKKTFFDWLGS
jgi:hypothetical protein